MACRSCDLKRIYRLFEEKKRREAEEKERVRREAEDAEKHDLKKKTYIPVGTENLAVEKPRPEDDFGLI